MADIQLKVTPAALKRHAGEIKSQIANAEKNWNGLCEAVNASRRYWEGDAGDCVRKLLEDMREDVRVMFSRLKEHPSDLLNMAGIYVDAEEKASSLANTLPDDAIQ